MVRYDTNAHYTLTMLAEGLDGKKAGPVRKVASEPQGLQDLKDKARNGLHPSEMNEHAAQPGGPLALPPDVSAVMDKIEEGHRKQCEGSNGERPAYFLLLRALLACCMFWNSSASMHSR